MKQAFISHASEDYVVAKSICRMLEERGIGCWIAPDDLVAGRSYGKGIIKGIEEASVTLLLLSRHSNVSQFVCKEIERAVSKQKPVLPVRLEDVQPSDDLELFVSGNQWIDVWPSPRPETMDRLVDAIRQSLEAPLAAPPARNVDAASRNDKATRKDATHKDGTPRDGQAATHRPVRKLVLAAGAGIAVIAGALAWQMQGRTAASAPQADRDAQAVLVPATQAERPAPAPVVAPATSRPAAQQASVAPAAAPEPAPREAQAAPAIAAPDAAQAIAKPALPTSPTSPTTSKTEAARPKKASAAKLASAAHADTPAPAHHTGSARSPSCTHILERASLGEPLSKDDQAILRTQC